VLQIRDGPGPVGRHAILQDPQDILQRVDVGALGRLEQASDVSTTHGNHTHFGVVLGIVVLLRHQAVAAPTRSAHAARAQCSP